MSRTFTNGTKHYEFEVMMIAVPNFGRENRGTYMNKRKHEKESGQCVYCTEFRKKKGCKLGPYILERAEMGAVSYGEIVTECIQGITARGFNRRIETMVSCFDGAMFLNDEHKYNFNSTLREIKLVNDNPPTAQMAAIYMLTASHRLWNQVKNGIYLSDIEFSKMHIHDLTTDSYAFYLAAKSIYTGESKIKCSEMVDSKLISDDTFKIMVHGKIVQKYGAEILSVKF